MVEASLPPLVRRSAAIPNQGVSSQSLWKRLKARVLIVEDCSKLQSDAGQCGPQRVRRTVITDRPRNMTQPADRKSVFKTSHAGNAAFHNTGY